MQTAGMHGLILTAKVQEQGTQLLHDWGTSQWHQAFETSKY
jgi:hypothetical protein